MVANLHAITNLSSNHNQNGSTIFALCHDGTAYGTGNNNTTQLGRPAPANGTTNLWRIPIPTAGTTNSGIALI